MSREGGVGEESVHMNKLVGCDDGRDGGFCAIKGGRVRYRI